MLLVEDNSTCVPIAPPPPIKSMEYVPFPDGDEFVKNKEETAATEEELKTPEEHPEDKDGEEGAVYGPSYPKYGCYHKVFTKYLISIKNLSELLEPPIMDWMAVSGTNHEMFKPRFLYK